MSSRLALQNETFDMSSLRLDTVFSLITANQRDYPKMKNYSSHKIMRLA